MSEAADAEEHDDDRDSEATARARRKPPRDDARLAEINAAFDAGDYAFVRIEAPKLARRTEDDRVRDAALLLRRRVDPDPLAKWLMLGASALLALLAGFYWTHPHGGP